MDLCASWVAGHWLSGTGEPIVVTSPIDGGALRDYRAADEAEIEAAIVGAPFGGLRRSGLAMLLERQSSLEPYNDTFAPSPPP